MVASVWPAETVSPTLTFICWTLPAINVGTVATTGRKIVPLSGSFTSKVVGVTRMVRTPIASVRCARDAKIAIPTTIATAAIRMSTLRTRFIVRSPASFEVRHRRARVVRAERNAKFYNRFHVVDARGNIVDGRLLCRLLRLQHVVDRFDAGFVLQLRDPRRLDAEGGLLICPRQLPECGLRATIALAHI